MGKASWNPTGSAPATNQNVALAVARQRLGEAHFRFALELIRRGVGEVAAPQALIIYGRLHDLAEIDVQALRNRVLVHLGQAAHTDVAHLPNTFVAIDGGVEWDIRASLVDRIRKRLGGRRNSALREWVQLHAGHVESKLLHTHVENLVSLREATDQGIGPDDVTRLYMQEMSLRDSLYEPLFNGLLERLYEQVLANEDAPADEAGEEPGDSSGEPQKGASTSVA